MKPAFIGVPMVFPPEIIAKQMAEAKAAGIPVIHVTSTTGIGDGVIACMSCAPQLDKTARLQVDIALADAGGKTGIVYGYDPTLLTFVKQFLPAAKDEVEKLTGVVVRHAQAEPRAAAGSERRGDRQLRSAPPGRQVRAAGGLRAGLWAPAGAVGRGSERQGEVHHPGSAAHRSRGDRQRPAVRVRRDGGRVVDVASGGRGSAVRKRREDPRRPGVPGGMAPDRHEGQRAEGHLDPAPADGLSGDVQEGLERGG